MHEENLNLRYKIFETDSELDDLQLYLLTQASTAALKANAPYSNFFVGAALLLEDKSILTGINQENASYPCGICAERAVLFSYGNQSEKVSILKMAVSIHSNRHSNPTPAAPCGLCRQVMAEFELQNKQNIELILGNKNSKIYVFDSLQSLLPFHFHPGFLV